MPERSQALEADIAQQLRLASTATLTTILFNKGLRNVFMQGVRPVQPGKARMVGPAYTLRMIPCREDIDSLFERDSRTDLQRVTTETVPAGAVLVVDSRGDAAGASGGALLALRMQVRGVAGIVTDGGFRDSPEIGMLDMPAFHSAPAAPPVVVRHHPEDVQLAIACGGVSVRPGDIIVGDDEGIVVIPRAMAAEVARLAVRKEDVEDFIAVELRAGRPVTGLYPPDDAAMRQYEAWVERGRPGSQHFQDESVV
ncbi:MULTISPECIES: ribonuclease activity regulator RraA [unclassified Sphingomonas]|uniref:ribonuclease activity regulator RraA n=1 Tax=unclassified Sphingomonas TaxID=196159 RepID=UPI00083599A7|nr:MULTISPECIES: ribonuclease activity regulator RraA [unclassified Sphingomonas]